MAGLISETVGAGVNTPSAVSPTPDMSLMNFEFAHQRLRNLVNNWEAGELKATQRRRRIRDIKVNLDDLRNRRLLQSDETYIPVRMIDTNIRRETPAYIQYLTQSRRSAIFKDLDDRNFITTKLEEAFTIATRYEDWATPFMRCLDGAMLHGYDCVEIVLDFDLPGGVGIEHIGHENLLFPMDARSIQQCEYIMRVYWCSILKLRSFVSEFGFDNYETEQLIKRIDGSGNTSTTGLVMSGDSLVAVYKVQFKYDGAVYVGWYHPSAGNWLKSPTQLYLGKTQKDALTGEVTKLPEKEYPIEMLYYQEGEKPEILAHYGRGMLDEFKQDAASSLWSAYVNGSNRASRVFGAPAGNTDTAGVIPKQTDVILEGGKMFNAPIDFFTMPYPSPDMLRGIQALDTQNSSETNQIAYAVNNREDSRKTATEIQASQQQTSQVTTVTVTMFASFLQRVYQRVWDVIKTLANDNKIAFLQIASGVDQLTGQEIKSNDLATINRRYQIRPAGDVDVIERQEKLQQRMQFWPVVQAIPGLAGEFLTDIIKTAFPDDAERYILAMQQGSIKNNVIQGLSTMLQAAVTKPDGSGLEDHFKGMEPQLQQMQMQVQQALQAPI